MTASLLASIVAALAVLVGAWAIAPLPGALVLLALVAWFAVPGMVAAWVLYEPGGRRAMALLVGPIWGYGMSSVVFLGLWVAGMRTSGLLAAPILAAVIAWALLSGMRGTLIAPRFGRGDVAAVCLLAALVPAVVGWPFSRVGEMQPDGKAYRAYFTADFVWRMAVAAELAKGEVPPRNPYFRGDRLRYYWLAHLVPAAEYRAMAPRVTLEQVLLVNSLALGVTFMGFLYAFVRQWVTRPAAVFAGCAIVLFCSSFEGLERLLHLREVGQPLDVLRTLNIDAVTRWFYAGLPIDGLHRLLWYQPHHSTGYALGLSCVLVLAQARKPLSTGLMAFCGTLLGLCLLLSTFSAMMLTAVVSIVGAVLVVRHRDWWALPKGAIAGALPLAGAVSIAFAMQYIDSGERSLMEVVVNPMAVTNVTTVLFLSLGPPLLISLAGAALAARDMPRMLWMIAVVVAVSLFFYFFVNVRDHQYVYVGWRAGHLLFMAFAVLTALAVERLLRLAAPARLAGLALVTIASLLALPTFLIDFYNTQDLSNRMQGAGFPWTLVLQHDEIRAFEFLRHETAESAIVQVEPFPRDPATWAYIPAFAERRMAAGLPISMVPYQKYQEASERVREVYATRDAEEVYARAARLRIDYLFVGPPEREAHPYFEEVLRSRPDLFPEVFSEGRVSIFYLYRAGWSGR
jgi:predicted outer membrane lipoprotein